MTSVISLQVLFAVLYHLPFGFKSSNHQRSYLCP